MPRIPERPIPEGITIDEEKLAREIEIDPLLNQYAMRKAKLEARQIKTTADHQYWMKHAREQYRLNMEAIYVELRVLRRRGAIRKKYMRKVTIQTAIEEAKNKQDAKLAAEFKKELREKLEAVTEEVTG